MARSPRLALLVSRDPLQTEWSVHPDAVVSRRGRWHCLREHGLQTKIGYAHVSTTEQDLTIQREIVTNAESDRIFQE